MKVADQKKNEAKVDSKHWWPLHLSEEIKRYKYYSKYTSSWNRDVQVLTVLFSFVFNFNLEIMHSFD